MNMNMNTHAQSSGPVRTVLPFLFVAGLLMTTTPDSAAQVMRRNTMERGFVSLPGSSSTKGLWAYEADGKQYCLQTRGGSGMAIIDMTDTSNATLVSNVPGTYRKVQVWQNFAYVSTDSGPTNIIDLTDVENPAIVGSLSAGAHTLRIDQSNGRLYLNRSSSMLVFDLTADPTSPAQVGNWVGPSHDCRPMGDILYANGFQSNPTRILRVNDPANFIQIGTLPTGNHSSAIYITPAGETVLLTCDEAAGGHVNIYNVDSAANPVLLSTYQTADAGASVHNIEIKGIYAYVAYYQDQLRILDISDPSNPVEVAVWDNNRLNTGSTFSDAWESIPDHDAVYMNQMFDTASGSRGTLAIDFFPGFGMGSDGTAGIEPQIWWSFGPATPGNTRFSMRLTNARPNTTAWLIVGNSNTQWGPNPLPLGMEIIGAPNAMLYVSPDFLFGVVTDAQGNAALSLPIPANAPFNDFWVQWLVKDVGAPNAGGWAFSKAGKIAIF